MCDSFEIDFIEEASLHAYLIFFTRSRLQERKFFFLKIESLHELVLKKMYLTVFS